MFIRRIKSKGHEYLYLMEDVTIEGRTKSKIIAKFGRADRLTDGQLRLLSRAYPNAQSLRNAQIEDAWNRLVPLMETDGANLDELGLGSQEKVLGGAPNLSYGHLIAKQVWTKFLGLPGKINYLQRKHYPRLGFEISTLACFLAASKMIEPKSYLKLYSEWNRFLANPAPTISRTQLYDTLGYLAAFKDQIMRCSYANLSKKLGWSKPYMLFFDCTNFYFEAPYDSREEFVMNYPFERAQELIAKGKSQAEISEYLQSEDFSNDLKVALDRVEKAGLLTRMRGPSKEGRYSQPIMGLSLVIDERGIPLDFELYPGNKSEYGYLKRAMESVKQKYGITDAFYVADRGLNSCQNLEHLQAAGFGFIVAQKISQQNAMQHQEMISSDGWKVLDLTQDPWATDLNEDIDGAAYRYKVVDHVKSSKEVVKDDAGNTLRREINVKCKLIYTFSAKRKRRDECVIRALTAKAQDAISQRKHANTKGGPCWRALVKTKAEVERTKEGKDSDIYVELNKDKIARMEAIAGYAALAVSAPKNSTFSMETIEVIAQRGYKQLVSIEASFRAAKSLFGLRPVYVKQDDHTLGHCLLCILALSMMKVIQYLLQQQGTALSLEKIQEALKFASVDALASSINPGQAMSYLKSAKDPGKHISRYEDEEPTLSNTDLIMLAVGLSPLQYLETNGSIRRSLKIDPDVPVLTKRQSAYLARLAASLKPKPK